MLPAFNSFSGSWESFMIWALSQVGTLVGEAVPTFCSAQLRWSLRLRDRGRRLFCLVGLPLFTVKLLFMFFL